MSNNNKADANIEKLTSPVIKSKTPYNLLQDLEYDISVLDIPTGERIDATVINRNDALSLIMTTQVEATVLLIKQLLLENKIVMADDLQKSFEDYTEKLSDVINRQILKDERD
jgi:hypothetical protein